MEIIRDQNQFINCIRAIQTDSKIEILVKTDNIMRDNFHTLMKIENRFFVKSDGNISPHQLGTHYTEITEKTATKIQNMDIDTAWREMDEISFL